MKSKSLWPGKTVTRETLSDAVQRAVGLSSSESKTLMRLVFEEIAATLESGETVKLSSFGSVCVAAKKGAPWPQPKDRRARTHIGPPHPAVQAVSELEEANKRAAGSLRRRGSWVIRTSALSCLIIDVKSAKVLLRTAARLGAPHGAYQILKRLPRKAISSVI